MSLLSKIWTSWKRIGQAIGDFIGRLILTVFYFTLFAPFALGLKMWGDPLDVKSRGKKVYWLERTTGDMNMNDVRRQS